MHVMLATAYVNSLFSFVEAPSHISDRSISVPSPEGTHHDARYLTMQALSNSYCLLFVFVGPKQLATLNLDA
jgi:hypothetical protein